MTTLHLGVQTMNSERMRGNIRDSLLAELTDVEKEKLEFRWKQAEKVQYGEWPDPTASQEMRDRWMSRVSRVLNAFFEKCGIVNLESRRQRVDSVRRILIARELYTKEAALDYAKIEWQLHQEGKGRNVLDLFKDDEMATKKQSPAHEPTPEQKAVASAVFSKPVTPDDTITERARQLTEAMDRVAREMGYKDSDLTLMRNVYRPYGGAVASKVVQHPDYVQLKVETAYREEIARMQKGPEKVAQEQLDEETLDAAFPRCKIHRNEPLSADNKCAICELNKSVSPDAESAIGFGTKEVYGGSPDIEPIAEHWSLNNANRGKFWGDVNSTFNRFPDSRNLDDKARQSFVHAVLDGSIKLTPLSQEQATEKVKTQIFKDFAEQPPRISFHRKQERGDAAVEAFTAEKSPEPTSYKIENPIPPSNDKPMTTPVLNSPPAIPVQGTQPEASKIAPLVEKSNGVEKPEPKPPKYTAPLAIQTLNGIPMGMIRQELDKPLPPQAYTEIKGGSMKGKTDIDVERIRDRFDQVFGSQGLGWAIEPIPGDSQILTNVEIREAKDKEGKPYQQTWYVVDLINYRLRYTVVLPDGSLKDCYGTAMSDSGDNMDRGYALEGTMTSLMKQAYRRMGGMNHIYYGVYTHIQAKRDLNAA